jgi:hypothetical protein
MKTTEELQYLIFLVEYMEKLQNIFGTGIFPDKNSRISRI